MDKYRQFEEVESFLRRMHSQPLKRVGVLATNTELTANGLTVHELWLVASRYTLGARSQSPVDFVYQVERDDGQFFGRIRLYVFDILGEIGSPHYVAHLSTRPGGHGMRLAVGYMHRDHTTLSQFDKAIA